MKRVIVYIALLIAALFAQPSGTDIGQLQPVEVVMVDRKWGEVIIRTDTGDIGRGRTFDSALRNLKDTTSGAIYLDTAGYLLVTRGAVNLLGELSTVLKTSVRVCCADGELDLAETAAFLAAHRPQYTLKTYEDYHKLDEIQTKYGRMILQQKILEKTEENA